MMTLWRPFDLARFESRLFQPTNDAPPSYQPAVDIAENEESFVITADLPGVKQQDLDLRVEDGYLTIKGKRESLVTDQRSGYRERRVGSFERRFSLGDAVDAEQIEARYTDGVLTVTLPKRAERKPRQIAINGN